MRTNRKTRPIQWLIRAILLITSIPLLGSLGSCATSSGRTIAAQTPQEQELRELDGYEEQIFAFRAAPDPAGLDALRSELKTLAGRQAFDEKYRSRLLGISGIAELTDGNRGGARDALKELERYPREERRYLLQALLAPENDRIEILEEGRKEAKEVSVLLIVLGEEYSRGGRHGEAVAAFDEAFENLPEGFRAHYQEDRDLAFSLYRNPGPANGSGTDAWSALEQLTVGAMIGMTHRDTTFLFPVTPDPEISLPRLHELLRRTEYLPPTIGPVNAPVPRKDAAWFVYRILAYQENDPSVLTAYRSIYGRNPAGSSPVPDVPVSAPYFDAALGLVERELFALPDGVHFFPNDPISGMELRAVLNRMRQRYR